MIWALACVLKRNSESGAGPIAWGAKQFQLRYFTKIIIMSLGFLSLTQLQNPYSKWNFKMSINLLIHQSPVNLWILHWVSMDNQVVPSVLGNFKQTALLIPHPVELGSAGTAVVRHSTVPHKTTVKAGWAHWLRLQPPHTLEEQLVPNPIPRSCQSSNYPNSPCDCWEIQQLLASCDYSWLCHTEQERTEDTLGTGGFSNLIMAVTVHRLCRVALVKSDSQHHTPSQKSGIRQCMSIVNGQAGWGTTLEDAYIQHPSHAKLWENYPQHLSSVKN